MTFRIKLLASAMGAAMLAVPVVVSAETLMEALTKAYISNPTLTAARAEQRGTDESVAISKAAGRPSAQVDGTFSEQIVRTGQLSQGVTLQTTPKRSLGAQGQINVPLYSGGSVRNDINASKLRVEAGQNNLRGTEASIFSRVVGAYMDVIRDSQIVLLSTQNVKALEVNLRASSDRFEVGDLTRTDVAQSESRLALARSDLQQAQAQLIASKENYTALVGTPPVVLEEPPQLPGLQGTPDAAVSIALADNPDIRAAQKSRDASRFDVKAARGQIAPRLSAFAQGAYTNFLDSQNRAFTPDTNKSATVGASITLPLYQGGRPAAAERQAVARESAAIERTVEVERGVISQVRAAFASWRASLETIESTRVAVRATALSLEGVKAENSVGTRTILEILNAEQEALNARVQLVSAQRNAYVAAFTLLAAMGHAEAQDLGLDPSILYDSGANYARVRNKFIDFDFDPHPVGVSTLTRNSPVQQSTPIIVPGY